jgi:hypothetical protein
VSVQQYQTFSKLVERAAGETEIENYLRKNHEVLSMAIDMFSTGHHMSWIFPKEQIRPPSGSVGGLIPDYLLAGASSNGVEWFVLELKGADKAAFAKRGKRVELTMDANEGICQLLNYIDRSSRDQAYLRDGLELIGFREPRGILLIGTENESDDMQVRDFKAAWNRTNLKLQIRSYNSLLRDVERKLRILKNCDTRGFSERRVGKAERAHLTMCAFAERHSYPRQRRVGTAHSRLCPPYDHARDKTTASPPTSRPAPCASASP